MKINVRLLLVTSVALVAMAAAWWAVTPAKAIICEGEYCRIYKHHHHKVVKPTQQQGNNTTGQWAVGCGIAAVGSEMIVAGLKAGDQVDPRQSTIFEAGWASAACPAFLPWALLVTFMCPDNPATYEIARQAHYYGLMHPEGVANWQPFTDAYGPACRGQGLSPEFLAFMKANKLHLTAFARRQR